MGQQNNQGTEKRPDGAEPKKLHRALSIFRQNRGPQILAEQAAQRPKGESPRVSGCVAACGPIRVRLGKLPAAENKSDYREKSTFPTRQELGQKTLHHSDKQEFCLIDIILEIVCLILMIQP